MHQKKFKWVLNSSFSNSMAQNLKETIIDTFVRLRLKEGFKCLFQSARFAVFTIQLTMFDTGDINNQTEANDTASKMFGKDLSDKTNDELKDDLRRHSAKNFTTFKNGSSQICTFIYIIRFFSNLSDSQLENSSPVTSLNKNRQNTGLLNVVGGNQESIYYSENPKNYGHHFPENGPVNKNEELPVNSAQSLDMNSLKQFEISFTTEIYVEAVDGIYQEKKSTNLTSSSFNLNAKKNKSDKFRHLRNFRNLTNLEIVNLIYLTDLKCFSILQSSYALFLSKSNPILNLTALLGNVVKSNNPASGVILEGSCFQPKAYFCSTPSLLNVYDYNTNYFDCIRVLPDLNIIPKNTLVKLSKNSKSSSVRSTYLYNRIKFNKMPVRQSKNSTSRNDSDKIKRLFSEDISLKVDSSSQKRRSSIEVKDKKSTDAAQEMSLRKSKKSETISLHEQLRPVLDCIDSNSALIDVNFQFTLRGILLESSLYVCVFEDVPLTLFNQSVKSQVLIAI